MASDGSIWRDSTAGLREFLSTPAGRVVKMPFVMASFVFFWIIEVLFLWLCVLNFRVPALEFLGYCALLFFWSLAAVWMSFYLVKKVWRAHVPSVAIFSDRFELEEAGVKVVVEFPKLRQVVIVGKEDEQRGYHAVFDYDGAAEPAVADLFDRRGFVEACRNMPQLRYKVRQKLGGVVGEPAVEIEVSTTSRGLFAKGK